MVFSNPVVHFTTKNEMPCHSRVFDKSVKRPTGFLDVKTTLSSVMDFFSCHSIIFYHFATKLCLFTPNRDLTIQYHFLPAKPLY